jgi:hypothetical protein
LIVVIERVVLKTGRLRALANKLVAHSPETRGPASRIGVAVEAQVTFLDVALGSTRTVIGHSAGGDGGRF